MSDTVVVVFSKNRVMQLDLSLRTFFANCVDHEDQEVNVLYTASSKAHEDSYKELISEWQDRVFFYREKDFQKDLLYMLRQELNRGKDYALMLVDDNIFTWPFTIEEIENCLNVKHNVLGFSLRLGHNTTYCYSHDKQQVMPVPASSLVTGTYRDIVEYRWVGADYDYGYPMDVSSSVLRLSDLLLILDNTPCPDPNTWEWKMFCNLGMFAKRPYLLCYDLSVSFCNPLNRVQQTNNNRSGSFYTADYLNEKYSEGYRIKDTFQGIITNSCHEEFDIVMEKKDGTYAERN